MAYFLGAVKPKTFKGAVFVCWQKAAFHLFSTSQTCSFRRVNRVNPRSSVLSFYKRVSSFVCFSLPPLSPTTTTLSRKVLFLLHKRVFAGFTTAPFSWPFIASCGKPQDPHLLISVTSVALSGHRCGASGIRLLEISFSHTTRLLL